MNHLLQNLSIKTKITIVNVAMIIGILVLGISGYFSVQRMLLSIANQEHAIKLIDAHADSDAAYDLAKTALGQLIKAAKTNDMSHITESKNTFETQIKRLEGSFDKLKNTTNSEIKRMVESSTETLNSFIKKSQEIIRYVDVKSLDQADKGYQGELSALNTTLQNNFDDVSKKIKNWANTTNTEAQNMGYFSTQNIIWSFLISLVLGLLVPLYLRQSLLNPMNHLLDTSHNLHEGKLTEEVPYLSQTDEIGKLSNAINALRLEMVESNQLREMLDEIPINILIADPRNDFKVVYMNRAIKETFNRLKDHLPIAPDKIMGSSIDIFHKNPQHNRRVFEDPRNFPFQSRIKVAGETIDFQVTGVFDERRNYIGTVLCLKVATASDKLARNFESSIGSVSSQITLSAKNLEQRSIALQGSIDELSAAAREISQRIHDSLSVVQKAVNKGDEARDHMLQLTEASDRISSVVTLIRSIAEKTNLLALNASIESARAGEAGKGFSVVANEVKNLANQTASAIVDIQNQIAGIQNSSSVTFESVKEICDTIMNVNQIATDIASAIEEQRASTSEISRTIGHGSNSVDQEGTLKAMVHQLNSASLQLGKECETFLEQVHRV